MSEAVSREFYLELFEEYVQIDRGLSGATVAAYKSDLAQFVEFLRARDFDSPRAVEVTDLREFVYELKNRGLGFWSVALSIGPRKPDFCSLHSRRM